MIKGLTETSRQPLTDQARENVVGLWEPRVWISGSQKWPPVAGAARLCGAQSDAGGAELNAPSFLGHAIISSRAIVSPTRRKPMSTSYAGRRGADEEPRTRAVVDDEGLAELPGELCSDQSRDDIRSAARPGGDNDGDRSRRIVLGAPNAARTRSCMR
jgi:hypothetical protein